MSQNKEIIEIIQLNNSFPKNNKCLINVTGDDNEAIKMPIIKDKTKEVDAVNNVNSINNIINYNNNNNNNDIEISDDEEECLVKIDDDCELNPNNPNNNNNSNNNNNTNAFYNNAQKYWNSIEPTINGMLGGFASKCHIQDVRGSNTFLREIFKLKPMPGRRQALDCGAGIGRVTKHLLFDYFESIDMVEQNEVFLNAAREYLGENCNKNVKQLYNQGLQDFTPVPQKYDIIWCQWVLGHLRDNDLVEFFKRCSMGLSKNGMLIVKENVTRSDTIDIDKIDSSVTRPLPLLKHLLTESNMRIVKIQQQMNFPKGLFPVYMIAVKPLTVG